MAYIQKNLPAPIPSSSFSFKNFTGGLNNVVSDSLLKENESPDLLNMTLNEEGTMEKRIGTKKYNNFNHNNPIVYMDKFINREGEENLVVSTDTEMFINSIKLCNVSKAISGTTYLNNYYFVDGSKIRIYGKFPQITSNNIRVVGTPVDTYVLLQVVNPPVFVPLGVEFTMGITVYNYLNGTIWYEPCLNELNDHYKGDNIIPTNPSMICIHKDRLFMDGDLINPGNVFIADILNPFYFAVGMPLQLPPNGQPITGMKVFMDSVVVGRKYDMYVIYGNTNRTDTQDVFLMKKINTHTGFMNNNSISEAHNYLFFLGSDCVVYKMHTTQTDVNVLATSVLSMSLDLFKYPISLTREQMLTCSSIFHNDRFYLFHKDVTLVYSYKFMAWTLFKGIKTTSCLSFNNELIMGSFDKYIYSSAETYDDDGIPIVAYYSSKMFDFGYTSNYKQFKELYIIAHVYNDFISTINVKYEIDYVDVEQLATVINQISRWGVTLWGERFLIRNIAPSLPITIGRRGRKLRFIIRNGESIKETVNTFSDLDLIVTPVHMNLYKVLSTGKFYRYALGIFTEIPTEELFQPLKVYEINGEYKIKGKR